MTVSAPAHVVAPRVSADRRGRNVAVVAFGNLVPPGAALLSAPIVARALGVVGRGEVAAATAPLFLAMFVGTLGLPDAVTYYISRDRARSTYLLRLGARLLVGPTLMTLAVFLALTPTLSDHNGELELLMVVSTAALPVVIGTTLLRGVAAAHHRWTNVAAEQAISAVVRIGLLGGLFFFARLTPLEATIITAAAGYAGVIAYLGPWGGIPWRAGASTVVRRRPLPRPRPLPGPRSADEPAVRRPRHRWPGPLDGRRVRHSLPGAPSLMRNYGVRVWIGSISGVLLLRLDQAVMTPLSSERQLGLYAVAVNFSEVALIVNNAVRDVTFVSEASDFSLERVRRSARVSGLLSLLIALGISVAMPVLMPFAFGSAFNPAVGVGVILLLAVVSGTPGSVAGAALSALGRPGLRSLSLTAACVVNLVLLIPLVHFFGAVGAAWATVIGNTVSGWGNVFLLCRSSDGRLVEFIGLRRGDLAGFRRVLAPDRRRRTATPDVGL